jgi:hypothetical protein
MFLPAVVVWFVLLLLNIDYDVTHQFRKSLHCLVPFGGSIIYKPMLNVLVTVRLPSNSLLSSAKIAQASVN